jgi:hypothetical protein
VIVTFVCELNPGSPQCGLPNPRGTLEPEPERTALTIEETSNPSELQFAADNVEREPSFPTVDSSCLPPDVCRTPQSNNYTVERLGSARQICGDFSISAPPASP